MSYSSRGWGRRCDLPSSPVARSDGRETGAQPHGAGGGGQVHGVRGCDGSELAPRPQARFGGSE